MMQTNDELSTSCILYTCICNIIQYINYYLYIYIKDVLIWFFTDIPITDIIACCITDPIIAI